MSHEKRPRILLLMHELSLTGSPKVILDAFDEISKLADVMIVSAAAGPLLEKAQAIGHVVVLSNRARISAQPKGNSIVDRSLHALRAALANRERARLNSLVDSWAPDVIYANSVPTLEIYDMLRGRTAPLLLHVHEMEYVIWTSGPQCGGLLNSAPVRYIAVAHPVKENLMRMHGIASEKIAVINEFVPDKDIITRPRDHSGPTPAYLVGGSGRDFWRKGMQTWLEMAKELINLRDRADVKLQWVGGSDDDRRRFEITARALGISDFVEILPPTRNPQAHYAKFDVFAMTSIEDPCPLVVLESMMLGTPVVCFAGTGGAPEEVAATGVVVADFCPAAMARSICDLLDHPDRRQSLGAAAAMRVRDEFAASVQVPKIFREIKFVMDHGNEYASK